MLTPKERLKLIFDGQKADRPACICPGGMMNMVTSDLMDAVNIYLPMLIGMQGKWRIWRRLCMKKDVSKIMACRSA